MNRLFHLFLFTLLVLPFSVSAASVDLGVDRDDISFSKEQLVAGDNIRIYASVKNFGESDVSGYVSFFQGSIPIGNSQVISVRTGGAAEEVFVDFVVPSGQFNIRAEIRGTDPQDENAENDVAITKLFTPMLDDDRDGIENEKDNCVDTENSAQQDADVDGIGDACDEDDDNDSVSDDVEGEVGTDPKKADTDDDGTPDAEDSAPTSAAPPAAPPPAVIPAASTSVKTAPSTDSTGSPQASSGSDEEAPPPPTTEEPAPAQPEPSETEQSSDEVLSAPSAFAALSSSPNAVFTYKRESWNTFVFQIQHPNQPGYRVEWDFGDGVTSTRSEVRHVYVEPGDFVVQVRVTDPNGSVDEDQTIISVGFFTLENRMIQLLIGALAATFLLSVLVWMRAGKGTKEAKGPKEMSGGAGSGLQAGKGIEGTTIAMDPEPSRIVVRVTEEEDHAESHE